MESIDKNTQHTFIQLTYDVAPIVDADTEVFADTSVFTISDSTTKVSPNPKNVRIKPASSELSSRPEEETFFISQFK